MVLCDQRARKRSSSLVELHTRPKDLVKTEGALRFRSSYTSSLAIGVCWSDLGFGSILTLATVHDMNEPRGVLSGVDSVRGF